MPLHRCGRCGHAGTCAQPIKRDNADGTTSLFARLDLTNTSTPALPTTCDKAADAADVMGGDLVVLTSAADLTLLRALVTAAAGKPVWVAPVDAASALAAALGYAAGPASGEQAALVLQGSSVVLKNVACATDGVAVMQTDVAGGASAPPSTVCTKQEAISPADEACTYTVVGAAQPLSASAAAEAARALGKQLLSFATQAEYEAVRASLAGSSSASLLATGALTGLWVDFVNSAFRPDGYSLPASGQASLLSGASLTPTNVPVATTVAAALVKKCSEVDESVGECAGNCAAGRVKAGRCAARRHPQLGCSRWPGRDLAWRSRGCMTQGA